MKPEPLEDHRLGPPGGFVGSVQPDDLVYFCCNVGDADAQLLLLPEGPDHVRRVIVVDAGATSKLPKLLRALENAQFLSFEDETATTIALVVATHPHHDHIAGIPQLLNQFGRHVAEFWEPAYFHPSVTYYKMMQAVAILPRVIYTQPTSGLQRFFGPVALTVLSPSIHLRNRFDTYGVEINDSSISLRFEHPARAVADRHAIGDGLHNWAPAPRSASLILGADAQTLSWSYVATDFPYLAGSRSPVAQAIAAATGGRDLLSADVLKVSHHASKNGVNLELITRIRPGVTIVSSTSGEGSYGFPHTLTQEIIREALEPTAGSVNPATGTTDPHSSDADLKIFYTSDVTDQANNPTLGSFAVILRGRRRQVWRFGDGPADPVDLTLGRRWLG